ncbi:MAG: bifunctional DNA primase/polymerase [Pseudonocardia sp.]
MNAARHPHPDHHRDSSTDPGAALLAAALDSAARGWPVFPAVPGAKRPALHGIDRCPRTGPCAGPNGHAGWEQRATTDPDRIRRAWSAGGFNVGLATGPAGLLVVDLDMPDPGGPVDTVPPVWAARGVVDGAGVLAWLANEEGERVPPTRTVTTPSGGRHLYFLAPTAPTADPAQGAPVRLRNTAGERGRGLGWKVDTRAHGGYVIAPGSRIPQGAYVLTEDRDPAPLPGWLARRLAPPPLPTPTTVAVHPGTTAGSGGSLRTPAGRISRYLHAAITAETARVTGAPAGQRNASLYVASAALGQLVAGGALPEHGVRAALRSAAAGHLALGAYSDHQAEQTITSGLRAGARRPRTITDPARPPVAGRTPGAAA